MKLICMIVVFVVLGASCGGCDDYQKEKWRKWGPSSSSHSSINKYGSSIIFSLYGNVYPNGFYFVQVYLGYPPRPYFLDPDTGSDLTWLQCDAPCVRCTTAYIDFEISEFEYERTRALYERLLNLTKHLKVWISYAKFEASQYSDLPERHHEDKIECLLRARAVFERELSYFRTSAPELKEERTTLLEKWLNLESSFDELGDVDLVRAKLPKKLKKRRHIETEDGPAGYEEYIDYLFPEETQTTNLKILEAAYKFIYVYTNLFVYI